MRGSNHRPHNICGQKFSRCDSGRPQNEMEVQQTNVYNRGFAYLLFLAAYHQIALTDAR